MTSTLDTGDGVAITLAGDVVIGLWKLPATLERVTWFTQRMRAEAMKRASGIVVLLIVLQSSTPPGQEARAESARVVQQIKDRLRRNVTLPAGDGLWSSVVRTIMRGLFLVSGQSSLQVVASNFDDAMRLVREKATAETPASDAVRAAAGELFDALAVARPAWVA